MKFRRLTLAVYLLLFSCLSVVAPANAEAAPPEGFAAGQIRVVWQRDDEAVASGRVLQMHSQVDLGGIFSGYLGY